MTERYIGKVVDGVQRGIPTCVFHQEGRNRATALSGETFYFTNKNPTIAFKIGPYSFQTKLIKCFNQPWTVEFSIFSTILRATPDGNYQRHRHPDMFAAELLSYSLNYWTEKIGESVPIVTAHWSRPTVNSTPTSSCHSPRHAIPQDNFTTFLKLVNQGQALVEAALATWTGKQLTGHGFTIASEDDVYIDNSFQERVPESVLVDFTRTQYKIT